MLELLVVIGIIGLLAAILLPALKQARERARRITCCSHVRAMGRALSLYKVNWGWYPDPSPSVDASDNPPPRYNLSIIGAAAKEIVNYSMCDPNAMYCPVSLLKDRKAYRPYRIDHSKQGAVINNWEDGRTSYMYLAHIVKRKEKYTFNGTFDHATESPDIDRNVNAVLIGDRTVEFGEQQRNMPGSNHGREGGWFYFVAGNADWRDWDTLQAHPTHPKSYTWYWPKTGGKNIDDENMQR
ncbi:MAG: type II secretion system protein [Planctomycetota bacterium]